MDFQTQAIEIDAEASAEAYEMAIAYLREKFSSLSKCIA